MDEQDNVASDQAAIDASAQDVEVAPTKMDVATDIYKRMRRQRNVTRKDIIAIFVTDANLSPAAASTYYQIIKARQTK